MIHSQRVFFFLLLCTFGLQGIFLSFNVYLGKFWILIMDIKEEEIQNKNSINIHFRY